MRRKRWQKGWWTTMQRRDFRSAICIAPAGRASKQGPWRRDEVPPGASWSRSLTRIRSAGRLIFSHDSLLTEPKTGMVQALDAHQPELFVFDTRWSDSAGRALRTGAFRACASQMSSFNFNGTAGSVAAAGNEEAGGWQHDTLTEDTNLSVPGAAGGLEICIPAKRGVPG